MSEKEIIERLILDMQCILERLEEDIFEKPDFYGDLEMYNQLINSGKYKIYPPYSVQTSEEKEEVKILANKNLEDE